jgi:dienelactone hydrolase
MAMFSPACMRHAILFTLCAAVLPATAEGAAERIEIKDGALTLRAMLYRPAGADRVPAVVALHGCGGLWTPSGQITSRFDEWGQRLMASGFAVLFPDSFGSRNLGSQCTNPKRSVRASRERVDDANAARRWLQSQAWVNPDRVSLIGWSNGASTTLWTVNANGEKADKGAAFHSAVALYPGCRELYAKAWNTRIPTLLLVGGADDWTPPRPCQDMVAHTQAAKAPVTIITYPGAYHDFDGTSPVRVRKGRASSADGSGTVHIGSNEPARADVIKRVPQWLAQ